MKRSEMVESLMAFLEDNGYLDGPCTYGPTLTQNTSNKGNHYLIGFSIPRIVDGCIRLFSGKFITVTWQFGRRTQNTTFDSFESLIKWLENSGYNGDYV